MPARSNAERHSAVIGTRSVSESPVRQTARVTGGRARLGPQEQIESSPSPPGGKFGPPGRPAPSLLEDAASYRGLLGRGTFLGTLAGVLLAAPAGGPAQRPSPAAPTRFLRSASPTPD